MRVRCSVGGLLIVGLVAVAGSPRPAAAGLQAPDSTVVGLPAGIALHVEPAPFRLVIRDVHGDEVLATVPGEVVAADGNVDGPQPIGPSGAFPALGFVVGAAEGATFPTGFYQGNRLFGAEAGTLASVVAVADVDRVQDGVDLRLDTDLPGAGPATLRIRVTDAGAARLQVVPPDDVPVVSTILTLSSPADEGLFGLGARKDAFDQRGRLRNVWTEQQNSGQGPFAPVSSPILGSDYTFPNGGQGAYFVQSLLLGSRGWGLWSDDSQLQRLDLAATRPDRVRWASATADATWTLAAGGIETASGAYTADTGRAPAPPAWVYGNWIDVLNEGEGDAAPNGARFDGGERVKADAAAIARKAESLDVPITAIGMEGWHKVPDVETFAADLRARGFRLSAYWNMFTSPASGAPYDTALANGWFVTECATGEPYPIVTNRQNVSYLIDFTHPEARAWWRTQLRRSAALGFEGFMHDFGELITDTMCFHSGEPAATVHNRYPVLYHEAARAAVDALGPALDLEPWFYVRAGFSGYDGQPGVNAYTSGVFPGDETTDWDPGSGLPSVVPAMLNLALGGLYTYTTDVGGYLDLYTPQTTGELLTRWHQLAVFTPISRIHNSTFSGSVHPWDFDDATLDIYRRYAKLNLRLAELKDTWSQRAATDGAIGPVRPLVLAEPDRAEARRADQWLLGTDILVAPIVTEGARSRDVYLPAGRRWERVTVGAAGEWVPTGDVHAGGQTVMGVPAPLADIPIFLAVDEVPDAPTDVTTPDLPTTGASHVTVPASIALLATVWLRRRRNGRRSSVL